ncbi:unnamed protein product [Arabidopsis thaliana]|uniref:MATH domain-containing protein n=2 Tax=Arabidopsis thaliana TaxID=3702 RepID=A0A5S9WPS9_ARATH|nr:unnamed protein product [Arabidopsis thaliana]
MGSYASHSAMLKTWRKTPPSRLVVYPKGNEEDNGKGFVSMYVECLSSTTPPIDVFDYLSFFVFNKKDNKYLSIQDVEVKRFSSSKTVWGLPKAMSLETFTDPAKGFIVEGEPCEFGAHVKIASSPVPVDENLPFHKFSWSIRDFSVLKQNDCISKTFAMGGKNWTLTVYPKGDSEADNEFCKYLHLADGEVLSPGEMISVRAQLRALDPRGSKHKTVWLQKWIMAATKARGIPQSLSLADLQEAYLDEDTLNVEIECEVVNSRKMF